MTPYRKRDFLLKAFFPHGNDVADAEGLFPVSPEVRDHESKTVTQAVLSTQDAVDFDSVFEMADWYVRAAERQDNLGLHTRAPVEDLVSFFMAAHNILYPTKVAPVTAEQVSEVAV